MIADEVTEKASGDLGAVASLAVGDTLDGPIEIIRRGAPVLMQERFHPLTFSAGDERVLELLRIDGRRVLAQKRNYFVGGNYVLHDVVALQQFHPGIQDGAVRLAPRRGFVRRAARHQLLRVLRRAQVAIEHGVFFVFGRHS